MMSALAYPSPLPASAGILPDPKREIRAGAAIIGVFVLGLGGWAGIARLDAAIDSPGVVRVAGNRQSVQSFAGGVISAIRVREGDRVVAGQVVVEFATTDTLAQERSLASRVFALQAEIARIGAEQSDTARVERPIEWTSLPPEDRALADKALGGEQANLAARRALTTSERAVLQQRIAQVDDQVDGYRQRQTSNTRQSTLNQQELNSVQALYRRGYATQTRVLALQRSAAAIDGEIGANDAEISRLHTSAGETRMQMMQIVDQRRQENSDRLRAAETELQSVLPQWKAARAQLEGTRVRAPVSGKVINLVANTVGGVVLAGGTLMEIVPTAGALVVETQVGLSDANDMHTGQKADVRIAGLRGRMLPPLHGTVSRVSADSLTDPKTGHSFYTATVTIPRAELDQVSRVAEIGGTVLPGTPVQVIVPLKRRTALQYLLAPLTERFSSAFTEN